VSRHDCVTVSCINLRIFFKFFKLFLIKKNGHVHVMIVSHVKLTE